jgi:hypothetical protein
MILPNKEEFNFKDVVIGGDECWLITPKDMATKWFEENSRFRSCIVRKSDNYVVSQGFRKFVNWGERPEFEPWDETWKFEARHKLDGSLLIVSRYKGEWIIRTRGTIDARQMPNGHEIDILMKKYSKFFECEWDEGYSILFEWTTPTNVVVLREHSEPTLTLVGMIRNDEGEYDTQTFLDIFALKYGFERPIKYEYNSISECLADVEAWTGKEGVVMYSPCGQILKKAKSEEYKELHKIRTGITGINQIVDLFIVSPRFTEFDEFFHYMETSIDFEVAEKCREHIHTVVQAYSNVVAKILMVEIALKAMPADYTRREQAIEIQQRWEDWRKSAAFVLLDGKPLEDKLIRIAILHELDKN